METAKQICQNFFDPLENFKRAALGRGESYLLVDLHYIVDMWEISLESCYIGQLESKNNNSCTVLDRP